VNTVLLRYAGREVRGLDALAGWMNVYWSDKYYVYDLSSALYGHAAACEVRGYPALVIANPIPDGRKPFVDVLFSAWYDSRSEVGKGPDTRGNPGARHALERQGFTLRCGPSGIRATIRGAACRRHLKEGIDWGAALEALAHLAASQGGRPQVR